MSERYSRVPKIRDMGRYVPEIRLEGDWFRVNMVLAGAAQTIAEGAALGQMSAGKKLEKIVKKHIRENGARLNWPLLTFGTQNKKSNLGYSPNRILYMTGTYYWSIKTWRKGTKVYTGIPKGIQHPISRLTIGQIANILEYGSESRNIPPRPLWNPAYKEVGGSKRVRGLILWHIRNQFMIKYGIRPTISI